MKHLKYFVICLLGTLLLPGCYKDLGNYDYDEINRVQFSNFPTEKQYAFKNVDSIKVYPKAVSYTHLNSCRPGSDEERDCRSEIEK